MTYLIWYAVACLAFRALLIPVEAIVQHLRAIETAIRETRAPNPPGGNTPCR